MDADTLNAILERLPENQRADAQKMIVAAEVYGITEIGFWEWSEKSKPHRFDLVGFDPHGRLRFLA